MIDERIKQAYSKVTLACSSVLEEYISSVQEAYKRRGDDLERYLLEVREVDKVTPLSGKNELYSQLEKVVQQIDAIKLFSPEKRRINLRNLFFDAHKALDLRKQAGYTQKGLVEVLGLKPSNVQQLLRFEKGYYSPANPPRGEFSKRYLAWLKEQGYNPYNL